MEIRLESVTKAFEGRMVIDHICLTVKDNDFATLLGPSGCGKTTLLRMIAGLETPDSGRILFEIGGKGLRAMGTSMFLAISAATIDAVAGTAVAMVAHKDHGHGTRQLTALALLPEMLPNIVLVIGLMLFWNQLAKIIPLYNTLGIMVLSYSVLFLPYSVQYVQSALALMGSHLEEAGLVSGGNPSYVFLHVTLPLLKGPIATGWMMTCIISLRELVCASLIAPPNKLVVSTFIMREFEQGSVSTGMAMAFLCTVVTTIALLVLNRLMGREWL